jgi:hypothetical protein
MITRSSSVCKAKAEGQNDFYSPIYYKIFEYKGEKRMSKVLAKAIKGSKSYEEALELLEEHYGIEKDPKDPKEPKEKEKTPEPKDPQEPKEPVVEKEPEKKDPIETKKDESQELKELKEKYKKLEEDNKKLFEGYEKYEKITEKLLADKPYGVAQKFKQQQEKQGPNDYKYANFLDD